MKIFRIIRNYLCYCGIEKERFEEVKKNAFASNYEIWRILHILMDIVFLALLIGSFGNAIFRANRIFYAVALAYSAVATGILFFAKKQSVFGQIAIHISVLMLFIFSAFLTSNKPSLPATTFVVFLLIAPMFVIDRPYIMAIELILASTGYLIWMYFVKDPEAWNMDLVNILIFTVVGILLHIIASWIRIKEFVLIREIKIQKDTDEMTGLMNKGALTSAINRYISKPGSDKGLMFLLDIDHFKKINDTFGHDAGDLVINRVGAFLSDRFPGDEIVGRWGGDEFIIFFKNTDDLDFAKTVALDLASEASKTVEMPYGAGTLSISIGISVFHGLAKNYSVLFKKADLALYQVKQTGKGHYCVYQDDFAEQSK